MHQNKVAEWLLSAPKIANSSAPFYWSYLDRPADGIILLTWQPEGQLGTSMASDGYVWAGAETVYVMPIDGYVLEIYQQKAGYAPGEPMATHARRRYRLLPGKFPNPSAPAPDPSLWITHYYPAEPADRVPSNAVPTDMRTQSVMQTRAYLQSQGQIQQKEFMLHDRSKWPQIAFPGRGPPQRGPAYFNPMQARTPQQMAYPAQQTTPGPAPKRARTQASQPHAAAQAAVPVELMDDEEDTSRGDMFDHMTPREVSQSRYIQNHEWMEEIFSSPVPVDHLVPVDLGLGLGGSLRQITNGIFETYNSAKYIEEGRARHEYIGRLDPGKAEEFRKRANEKVEAEKREIEKLRRKHARRMAKLQRNAVVVEAEKALRTAVNEPSDIGTEYWRLEGKISSNDDEEEDRESIARQTGARKVDDIVAALEASLGLHAAAVQELRRIQDGGLQDRIPAAPPVVYAPSAPGSVSGQDRASRRGSAQSGVLVADHDHDLDMGSAAGLLDQFHTGFSAATTPGNGYTPQHLQGLSAPASAAASPAPQERADVEMGGTEGGAGGDAGDWVVVPAGGVTPPAASASAAAPKPAYAPILPPGAAAARRATATAMATTTPSAAAAAAADASAGTSATPAPAVAAQSPAAAAGGEGTSVSTPRFEGAAEPVDFSGLDDLDTAGFEGGMGMGMGDESAFGDAFVEREGEAEEGEGGEGEGGM